MLNHHQGILFYLAIFRESSSAYLWNSRQIAVLITALTIGNIIVFLTAPVCEYEFGSLLQISDISVCWQDELLDLLDT